MNIVLSGPFGLGSLSDELVLAGVIKPLRAAQHEVTVFSADKAATAAMHGVDAVTLPSPASISSTNAAWKALDRAHFFGICGAGVISDKGKAPARIWMAQLEYAKQMKAATAVVGAGAAVIDDKMEAVRVQRFLHHFADSVSVRDESSKAALVKIGLNPNRVSASGDPVLGLFDEAALDKSAPEAPQRVAFFFADGVPMRHTFAPAPTLAPAPLASGLNALLTALAAKNVKATIFHDATQQNKKLARQISANVAPENAVLMGPEATAAALCQAMRSCSAAVTDTLHGLLFAAAHGVPAVYFNEKSEVAALSVKLGMGDFVLAADGGAFDCERALDRVNALLQNPLGLRAALIGAVAIMAKKESQNARMIERLVPKRSRYPKDVESIEARAAQSKAKRH